MHLTVTYIIEYILKPKSNRLESNSNELESSYLNPIQKKNRRHSSSITKFVINVVYTRSTVILQLETSPVLCPVRDVDGQVHVKKHVEQYIPSRSSKKVGMLGVRDIPYVQIRT